MVCSDKKSSVLFKPCGHMCVCESCSQIMKKCVLCRQQIELMVSMTVCSGGLGTISEVKADSEEDIKPSSSSGVCVPQGPIMNNGGRDTTGNTNDIQKLQQQLQDIKEQVGVFLCCCCCFVFVCNCIFMEWHFFFRQCVLFVWIV